MSAVGLHLDVLRMDAESQLPEVARGISETQAILEKAFEQVRSLSHELNPSIVERVGLKTALDRLVERFRRTGDAQISLELDSSVRLPAEAASSVYRIAECALDNAARHSKAKQVEVLVEFRQPASVVLQVRDDGIGFDIPEASAEPRGLGLLLMKYYAVLGRMVLELRSERGGGTIVRARSDNQDRS